MKYLTPFIIVALSASSFVYAKPPKDSLTNKGVTPYEIKYTSALGVDSNPYRFSDRYQKNEGEYLQQTLSVTFSLSDYWSSKFAVKDIQYQHASNWADSQKRLAVLAYGKDKKRQENRFNVKYEQLDKTYVSRLSGGLSRYSGAELNDRYNYQQLTSYWSQKKAVNRKTDWQYKLEYRIKDYDDFSSISISNLDYQSFAIGNQFHHKASKRIQHQVGLNLSQRNYKDKRQKDIKGKDINNTDLNYLDTTLGYEILWKQNKRHKISVSFDYLLRKDNSTGYYDSHESTLRLTSKYRLNTKASFSAQYQYVDFSYERPTVPSSDPTTEDYSSHQQHRIKLGNRINLKAYLPLNAQLLINYQYVNENSDKSQYSYERHIVETGLRFKF